jgi:hypothetical protein
MAKSSRTTRTVPHGQFEVELAELALGLLHGGERDALLEHVSSCAGCRARLLDLEAAAGSLLLRAPEADPPVGFEQSVLDRIQARCSSYFLVKSSPDEASRGV